MRLSKSPLREGKPAGGGGVGSLAFTFLPPVTGRGLVQRLGSRTMLLLGVRGTRPCARLAEGTVPPLAVRLKRLGLHHLATVAAHNQVEVVVRRAVAVYLHVCMRDSIQETR